MELIGKLITSNRCIIRPFEQKDLDMFVEYRNDEIWMKHQGFKGFSKDSYRKYLIVPFVIQEGGQLAICDRISDELLGDVYLKKDNNQITIGFTIHPKFSRKGYVFEVVKELVCYFEDEYVGIEVLADAEKQNISSINLLLKLGFVQIAETEEEYYFQYKRTPLK